MRLIEEAWGDLKRNQASLFLYVGLVVAVVVTARLGQIFLGAQIIDGKAPTWAPLFSFFLDLCLVAAYSAIIAIIFARIGEEIDRPLWKFQGVGDSLKRFFLPWFIINLLMSTTVDLLNKAVAAGNDELVILLTFFVFFGFLFAFPIGTCIMHHGRLDWGEFSVALAPIVRLFVQVLPVLFVGFMQFVLVLIFPMLGGELTLQSVGRYALLDAVAAVLDCLIFAMMWRVCIRYRNYEADNEGGYFDF